MKLQFIFTIMFSALQLLFFGCAHWSDPCNNKLLKHIPSPDGNLVLSTYHRECPSKVYTTAALEKPGGFFQSKGEVVCYLMSWGDRHPVEAEWKDANNIFISTADRLQKFDFAGIKVELSEVKKGQAEVQKQQQSVHRVVALDVPLIPLWQLDPLLAIHNDVKTVPFDRHLIFTDVELWRLEGKPRD